MSMDATAGRPNDLPLDVAPQSADVWSIDFPDPLDTSANFFSAEIEDVDASHWDVDTEQIWGDETDHGGIDDGGGLMATDFPL